MKCDLLIVGGGVGGCAAALAAARMGLRVVMSEETAWIGGQLTSQGVPPDEHPWIEHFGCTASYREFREKVRALFQESPGLSPAAKSDLRANPGGGWVSKLCAPPALYHRALQAMFEPYLAHESIQVLLHHLPSGAEVRGDRIQSVTLLDQSTGAQTTIEATTFIDATETGELLPRVGAEFVTGAESRQETGEPHAVDGPAQPDNVQGFTWCFAMGYDSVGEHVIEKPAQYERWKSYRPKDWPGPLLGWVYPNPITLKPTVLPLFAEPGGIGLFDYRQIVDASKFDSGARAESATLVNWPQNDYFEGNLLDAPESEKNRALEESRQLSLSLLYWLQTEAPRPDGGAGYPGLRLRPDLIGTADGLAMTPYIRESRRIKAQFTVLEQHVSSNLNPGRKVAEPFWDSVGVGAYRIDLHPSTSGAGYIDIGSLPFEIPLGALIPVRMENLIAGAKNIGTTHITNGCYRLHPVEWAIGEAAGRYASLCGAEPVQYWHGLRDALKEWLNLGVWSSVPRHWPDAIAQAFPDPGLRELGPL